MTADRIMSGFPKTIADELINRDPPDKVPSWSIGADG